MAKRGNILWTPGDHLYGRAHRKPPPDGVAVPPAYRRAVYHFEPVAGRDTAWLATCLRPGRRPEPVGVPGFHFYRRDGSCYAYHATYGVLYHYTRLIAWPAMRLRLRALGERLAAHYFYTEQIGRSDYYRRLPEPAAPLDLPIAELTAWWVSLHLTG
jgi:hypothetical protein